jgi:AraC-like DNA-binding protein
MMIDLGRLRGLPRLVGFLKILDLLSNSKEGRALSSPRFVPATSESDCRRIDRACRHINEKYRSKVTLGEAASIAGLSATAFSRFFKKKTGWTFKAYLNELRIGCACRMLIETDEKILNIALDSGFNNLANFNRRFLALKKTSPRAYRKQFAR